MSGVQSNTARRVRKGSTLPATCSPGEVFGKTGGGSEGLYFCVTANTWVGPFVAGSAGITNAAGNNVIPKSDGTNLVASAVSDNGTTVAVASRTITQTSASATAFESGPNGGTNPVLRVVNSTASQADGVSITGLAAGSGTRLSALSSGADSGLVLNAKGTGNVDIVSDISNLLFRINFNTVRATARVVGDLQVDREVRIDSVGDLTLTRQGAGTAQISNAAGAPGATGSLALANLIAGGYVSTTAPVTKTDDFAWAATENWVIVNKAGSVTVTLPAAASFTGRELHVKTIQAQTVVSASSNVVPLAGGAAGTAILAATAGKWATLVSDGTNWIIMEGN